MGRPAFRIMECGESSANRFIKLPGAQTSHPDADGEERAEIGPDSGDDLRGERFYVEQAARSALRRADRAHRSLPRRAAESQQPDDFELIREYRESELEVW